MTWLLLTAPVLSALLLAAHFYRAGLWPLAVVSIAALALLFVPRPWAARALQAGLVIGAVEWLRTLAMFAAQRMSAGQPWLRLTVILGAVALVTAAAALVFRHRKLRERFGLGGAGGTPPGPAP